jgi:hypothetical protein
MTISTFVEKVLVYFIRKVYFEDSIPMFRLKVVLYRNRFQNIINRQNLIENHTFITGVPVFTAEGERVGESGVAAKQGIAMVTASRIAMAAPGMVLIPMFMDRLEKKGFLAKYVLICNSLKSK